jgi:hypothetical protein
MVKTIIMTSVRATGPGAGPSMLNIGAADIVRGHMVVHDLGAGSERVAVRSPLHLGLAWIYEADFSASRSGAVRGRPGQAERTSKRSQSRADEVVMAKTSTLKGGTTAALRDVGRVFVCFGSVASDQSRQQPRAMSALPPIATELVRRNEVTLCAISRQSALQHFVTPDANRAHCSFKRF